MTLPSTADLLSAALGLHDETELPRPYCDGEFHTSRPEDDGVEPDHCPVCLGDWWAIDGSEPFDFAMNWLRILARRAQST